MFNDSVWHMVSSREAFGVVFLSVLAVHAGPDAMLLCLF